eukprot:1146558-Pelagomonas_calceolata.AAC.5
MHKIQARKPARVKQAGWSAEPGVGPENRQNLCQNGNLRSQAREWTDGQQRLGMTSGAQFGELRGLW